MDYITTKDKKQAITIGKALMKKKLAACVNIIPSMYSSFRWQGKILNASEAILIVKSIESKKEGILKEVKRLHSYSVPCILFVDIQSGNPDYIQWLHEECF